MALLLEDARMQFTKFSAGANEFDNRASTRAYEAAFKQYGISVGELTANEPPCGWSRATRSASS